MPLGHTIPNRSMIDPTMLRRHTADRQVLRRLVSLKQTRRFSVMMAKVLDRLHPPSACAVLLHWALGTGPNLPLLVSQPKSQRQRNSIRRSVMILDPLKFGGCCCTVREKGSPRKSQVKSDDTTPLHSDKNQRLKETCMH